MEEKNQSIYESMMANKSLAPIAELARLVMVAENTAKQADEIGDKLSVFACRAEAAQDDLPPVTAWMELCDTYKDGARDFALLLRKAIEVSRIDELEENMKTYADGVVRKTAWLVENNDEFRALFKEAVYNLKNKKPDAEDAE